jgi:radical SAM protein with 4Fe4S-binding SPASM domain
MTNGDERPIPLFERVQIESQALCNRACWFCPRTYDRKGKYLDRTGRPVASRMPTETILDLLDQCVALGFEGRIAFHHYSEPLLDSRNVMLAESARARGLHPYLHTNGDMLRRDDALCEDVVRVYDRIIVGLYDYETDEELEEARGYWRRRLAAAADLDFNPIGRSGGRSAHSNGVPRALVPPDARMVVPDLTFANAPCHRPLIRLIVQHDGEVAFCCEDVHGAFEMGNVYASSVEELWYSERHVRAVRGLVAGRRQSHALCRHCPLPPTGPAVHGGRVVFAPRRYGREPDAT